MVETQFKDSALVPLVCNVAPQDLIQINYNSKVEVKLGNDLTPTQVKDKPTVTWPADTNSLYTLCMTDPDTPGGIINPGNKNTGWKHWLVVNIPGSNIEQGTIIADYIGSGPMKNSGKHRYVFLVYKQPGQITPDDSHATSVQIKERRKFTVQHFATKYGLGEPVAGNFYLAEYDDSVPEMHKKIETMCNVLTYVSGKSVSK